MGEYKSKVGELVKPSDWIKLISILITIMVGAAVLYSRFVILETNQNRIIKDVEDLQESVNIRFGRVNEQVNDRVDNE